MIQPEGPEPIVDWQMSEEGRQIVDHQPDRRLFPINEPRAQFAAGGKNPGFARSKIAMQQRLRSAPLLQQFDALGLLITQAVDFLQQALAQRLALRREIQPGWSQPFQTK